MAGSHVKKSSELLTNASTVDPDSVEVGDLNINLQTGPFAPEVGHAFRDYVSTLASGNVKTINTGTEGSGKKNSKKKKTPKDKKRAVNANSDKQPTEGDALKVEEVKKTPSTVSIKADNLHPNWAKMLSGDGLFDSAAYEKVWFSKNVRGIMPIEDPLQLQMLGDKKIGRELPGKEYTAGEGVIIHITAGYYRMLPDIGFHLDAMKVMHYLTREVLGLDKDDEDEDLVAKAKLIKSRLLKRVAYVVGDKVLPRGADSSKTLLDVTTPPEICECIEAMALADAEIYTCYNAIAHTLEQREDERVVLPDYLKYLYLYETYTNCVAKGKRKKEFLELNMPVIYPKESSAAYFKRIRGVDESENEEDSEVDLDGPTFVDDIAHKDTTDEVKAADKGKGTMTSSKKVVPQKRKRASAAETELDEEVEEGEVEGAEDDDEREETDDEEENPKAISEFTGKQVYVTKEVFLSAMKQVGSQLKSMFKQQAEMLATQNKMMDQIGQSSNQSEPDEGKRDKRTAAISKSLLAKPVPKSAMNVVKMSESDQELVNTLKKPNFSTIDANRIIGDLKARLASTTKSMIADQLNVSRLMAKSMRDRLVEGLKELYEGDLVKMKQKSTQEAGVIDLDKEVQDIFSSINNMDVEGPLAGKDGGKKKKK